MKFAQTFAIASASAGCLTLTVAAQAFAVTLKYEGSIGRPANLSQGEALGTPGTLAVPQGITVQESTGTIFVSNGRFIDRVEKFDSQGNYLGGIGGSGTGPGQFDEPSTAEFSPFTGDLYVGDVYNNRVEVFNPQGNFIKSFANGLFGGYQPGRLFFGPSGMTFDSAGNFYVGDFSDDRILKFTADGQLLSSIGTTGTAPGEFQGPAGIRISPTSGNIFVSDQLNNRVQVLDPTGKPLLSFGSPGSAPGQFNQPIGLDVDEFDNIYVADSVNSRVEVFDKTGKFLTEIGEPARTASGAIVPPPALTDPPYGSSLDLQPGVFNWTGGTAYQDGKLYVEDFFQGRVQVFDVLNRRPEAAASVPEPTTILGTAILGLGMVVSKLRKRWQQS